MCQRRDVGVGETKARSVPHGALQLHNAVRRQRGYYAATVLPPADYLTCIMQQVSPTSPTAKGCSGLTRRRVHSQADELFADHITHRHKHTHTQARCHV